MLQEVSKTNLGTIIALLTAVVFGVYPAAARGAYAEGANATFLLLFTVFVRAMMLSSYCWIKKEKFFTSQETTKWTILAGLSCLLSISRHDDCDWQLDHLSSVVSS